MDPNPPAPSTPISSPARWAHLRFSVVGPLLASPPAQGELHARLRALADQAWELKMGSGFTFHLIPVFATPFGRRPPRA